MLRNCRGLSSAAAYCIPKNPGLVIHKLGIFHCTKSTLVWLEEVPHHREREKQKTNTATSFVNSISLPSIAGYDKLNGDVVIISHRVTQ
jgi:hypothetical protein